MKLNKRISKHVSLILWDIKWLLGLKMEFVLRGNDASTHRQDKQSDDCAQCDVSVCCDGVHDEGEAALEMGGERSRC